MHSQVRLCNPASADKMWIFGCKRARQWSSQRPEATVHYVIHHILLERLASPVCLHTYKCIFLEMPSWTLGADIYPPNTRLVFLYHWWSFTPSSLPFFFSFQPFSVHMCFNNHCFFFPRPELTSFQDVWNVANGTHNKMFSLLLQPLADVENPEYLLSFT